MSEPASKLCASQAKQCGFQIEADKKNVKLTDVVDMVKEEITTCPEIRMKYKLADFCTNPENVWSCDPAIDENKVITIVIHDVSPTCPITILNAKVYVPSTTPTETEASEKTEESNTLLIVLAVCGVVILLIVIVWM